MQRSSAYYFDRFPELTHKCTVCGKEFNAIVARTNPRGTKKYRVTCSEGCSYIHTKRVQRAYTKQYKKTNPKYKDYERRYNATRAKE